VSLFEEIEDELLGDEAGRTGHEGPGHGFFFLFIGGIGDTRILHRLGRRRIRGSGETA
jgi:hypothetical protein